MTQVTQIYEVTVLLRQDMSLGEIDASASFIKSIFKKNNIDLIKEENWGIRNLAYPIKGNITSTYVCFTIKADGKQILELDSEIKLEQTIIRHAIIKVKHVLEEESYLSQIADHQVES